MTESDAVRAAVAAQRAFDSATKLLCFVDVPQGMTYARALEADLIDLAEAFGYELTPKSYC